MLLMALMSMAYLLKLVGGTEECSREAINACIGDLEMLLFQSRSLFPYETDSELQRICSQYEGSTSCIDQVIDSCEEPESFFLHGYNDLFNFICNDGRSGFVSHRSCFSSSIVIQMSNDCQQVLDERLSLARFDPPPVQCDIVNDGNRCNWESVESVCGWEAADWQHHASRLALSPMLMPLNCHLDDSVSYPEHPQYKTPHGSSYTSAGRMALMVMGIVIVALLAVILLIVSLKYRGRERTRLGTTTFGDRRTETQTVTGLQTVQYNHDDTNPSNTRSTTEGVGLNHTAKPDSMYPNPVYTLHGATGSQPNCDFNAGAIGPPPAYQEKAQNPC